MAASKTHTILGYNIKCLIYNMIAALRSFEVRYKVKNGSNKPFLFSKTNTRGCICPVEATIIGRQFIACY